MSQQSFYLDLRGLIPPLPLLQGQFICVGDFSTKITDACPITQLAISKGLKRVDGSIITPEYLLATYNDDDEVVDDIVLLVIQDHYHINNRVTEDFIEAWDEQEFEESPNTIDLNNVIDLLEEAQL